MSYTPPPPPVNPPVYQKMSYSPAPEQPAAPPPTTVLMLRNGRRTVATSYWFDGSSGSFRYVALNGTPMVCSADLLDVPATVEVNRSRGVTFYAPGYSY